MNYSTSCGNFWDIIKYFLLFTVPIIIGWFWLRVSYNSSLQSQQTQTQKKTLKITSAKLKKRVPYSQLADTRWRLDQANSLLHELAGEGHSDYDFQQFFLDLCKRYQIASLELTEADRKIRSNIKDLVSEAQRCQTILAAKLTNGLKLEEASELTGLSVYQIRRARNQLADMDWKNLTIKVLYLC
jgi:hypothetical protein